MKKIGFLLLLVMFALSSKAQVYIAGSTSLWHNHDADITSFSIIPEVGYNFNKQWAVGAALGFSHNEFENVNWDHNSFLFNPYVRYSFYENKLVRLFVDGSIGVSTNNFKHGDSDSGFELGFKPGIAIKLNNHFSLLAKCGFLGYRDDYAYGENGYGFAFGTEDLSLGVHYEF